MASALTSPFHGLPISEAVPGAADLTELKQSSILQGRRRVRFQAQTGVSITSGGIAQFVLSDSTGLIDANSIVVSGTLFVTPDTQAAANNPINLADDGPSIFRRVQVLFNGQLVDDVDNAHRAANLEVLSSAESDWIKHDGTICNYWKYNETLSVNAATAQNDVQTHAQEITADLSGNGYQVAWPLGLLAPSLRSNKYLPIRNMGEMVIQLTMAQPGEAIWNKAGNPVNYTLNDLFLEVDVIVPHPMFANLLDRMCQLESEPGLTIPVMSRIVSQGQSIPASLGAITESSIITSRATTNLRRLMCGFQPTAGLNSYTYPSVSCFPDAGCAGFQIRVGSLYFPSQPSNSKARMFFQTSAAFGEPASTEKAAIFNRHNYDTTTSAGSGSAPWNTAGYVAKQVPGAGGQFLGTLTAAAGKRFPYSDFAPLGYCFDAYKNTSEPLANDGISILGQAGSQVVTIVRLANPEAVTPTLVLDATKVLVLKDGGLRVMGA